MHKNIPWQILIIIGLVCIFVGHFIGGVIGAFVEVFGDICFLIGIANAIVSFIKKRKERRLSIDSFKEENYIKKSMAKVEEDLSISKDKTISCLERKVWYRSLKVLYVIFFASVFITVNVTIFDEAPTRVEYTLKEDDAVYREDIVGKTILDEERRKQLDGIVSKMEQNKESEEDIRFVVEDFKKKYTQEKGIVEKYTLEEEETLKGNPDTKNSGVIESPKKFISDEEFETLYEPLNKVDFGMLIVILLIANSGIFLFFEILRRIFYYISLGSLRPQR